MSSDRQATPLPNELNLRELLRWAWRQLTSMRTALVLLLLLALAAIPGSIFPQEDIDSLAVTTWKDDHPKLTPIWERLDLFSVYDSAWFSAIYILLMVSLVGCIIPRMGSNWRGSVTACSLVRLLGRASILGLRVAQHVHSDDGQERPGPGAWIR